MILKRICCLAAALAIVVPSFAGINRNDVKEIADRVADWQIANFKNVSYTGKKRAPLDWANGALFRGMVEWSAKTGYQPAEDFVMNIAKTHDWHMARRLYHADDICVGQAFLLLYEKYKDPVMLQYVKERADSVIDFRSHVAMDIHVKGARKDGAGATRCSWLRRYIQCSPKSLGTGNMSIS